MMLSRRRLLTCMGTSTLTLQLLVRPLSALSMDASKMTVDEFFNKSHKKPTTVTICGSQRIGSFNKMLHDAACTALKEEGAIVKPVDLSSLNVPIYDPNEEEEHFPDGAHVLKSTHVDADGIFLTSPEYNGFVTPLLCNSLSTWATRGEGGMYFDAFKGKVVDIMATSPGPMGGLRMLHSMHQFMQDMGAVVVPGHNSVGSANKVFDSDGNVMDEKKQTKSNAAAKQVVHFARYEANRERDFGIFAEMQKLSNMGEYGKVDTYK